MSWSMQPGSKPDTPSTRIKECALNASPRPGKVKTYSGYLELWAKQGVLLLNLELLRPIGSKSTGRKARLPTSGTTEFNTQFPRAILKQLIERSHKNKTPLVVLAWTKTSGVRVCILWMFCTV